MPVSPTDRSHDATVEIVRRGYDAIAGEYLAAMSATRADDPRGIWTRKLTDRIVAGARVLDVGCGPGVPTAAHLVACGCSVVGVDVSARQIELATEHVREATFSVGDVARLEMEADSFDAIVALFSLTHVPRDEYASLFRRFASWLAPGGWFLASLGRSDSSGWDEDDFLGFGGRSWTNSFDVDPTLELLRGAGLRVEEHALVDDDTPFGPERWLWVLARANP